MFVSYEVSIQLVAALRLVVPKLRAHDPSLADQIKRAASSIPLNLAEGRKRIGKDRIHLFRIASGSVAEVGAALDAAVAWGYLDDDRGARALVDRLLRLTWGLTKLRG